MKKIKVYLQYPWKFPDSPQYKYLIENPPTGISYQNTKKQKGVITARNKFLFSNNLKKIIRNVFNRLNISIPNVHLSPKGDYDLIYCAHCLSKNDKPWVVDMEGGWQFYIGNKNKIVKDKVRKILLNKNCKKIMAWTEYCAKEIIQNFPEIKEKVELVYPAVPLFKRRKEGKKITILYATRHFWIKGGLVALEVLKRLQKKYKDKIEIIFISDVPDKIKKRYPQIKIKDLVSQAELRDQYKKADIFFYPSMQDTFGFGLLEAMSFGLVPVVLNHDFWGTPSMTEIITKDKTGFIVRYDNKSFPEYYKIGETENNLITSLLSKISLLIENEKLRKKMSENCIKEIKRGKFSIFERNKKLRRIYEEALK